MGRGVEERRLRRLPNLVGSETGVRQERIHTVAVRCAGTRLSSRCLNDSSKQQKQTTGVKASRARTGIYTGTDTYRVRAAEVADLEHETSQLI